AVFQSSRIFRPLTPSLRADPLPRGRGDPTEASVLASPRPFGERVAEGRVRAVRSLRLENILQLGDEPIARRRGVLGRQLVEFFQKFALAFGQILRYLDVELHIEIAGVL